MKQHYCPVEKSQMEYEGECNWCGEKELNWKIKQLAEDARSHQVVLTAVGDQQWQQHLEFCQIFSDLIIFECIKLAVFHGDKETGNAIQRHFGFVI